MSTILKNLIPILILAVSLLLFANKAGLSSTQLLLVEYLTYFIFSATALLGFWFNRCRIFFQVSLLVLSLIAMLTTLKAGPLYFQTAFFLISLLLPINLVIFSIFKERGIFSFWGKAKIGLILFQTYLCTELIVSQNVNVLKLAEQKIGPIEAINFLNLPHLSMLAILLCLALAIIRVIYKNRPVDNALLGVLLTLCLAFYSKDSWSFYLFFSTAGLMLVIAIIQDTYLMAYMDELTGLPGRRAFKDALLSSGGKYSLAILDIDFFKAVNDTHGHDVGDDVLKFVAGIIKKVSGGGKAFRYGGEEFLILFPGKSSKEAEPYLEELRLEIAEKGFTIRSRRRPFKKPKKLPAKKRAKKIHITVSIGLAEKNTRQKTSAEVIKAADKALYQAKNSGRNCLCKAK